MTGPNDASYPKKEFRNERGSVEEGSQRHVHWNLHQPTQNAVTSSGWTKLMENTWQELGSWATDGDGSEFGPVIG